ncbi:hypothetical protein [Paenibacillus sp. FSL R5-0908]|uniref:hypothetical protein n=1 Tax=Paenibacillus sp. FSL R5-0908 TaxID=2921664 RepID=UPI0030F9DE1D
MSETLPKIVKVENHKSRTAGLLQHIADVTLDATVTPDQHHALVDAVSAKLGYHPMGHGIYGARRVEDMSEPFQYRLSWQTGNHCD